ncbi:hypothetical protein [Sorangium sp. So ce385]|uniref:hypothetical protein n=1 Tax=Sorangium sp. So ce385 TaxID=3133308 RepID=UPI003F5C2891
MGKTYAKVLTRVDCTSEDADELLSQVDVFAAEPSGRKIRGDLMSFREDLRICRGDVLIAGAGQLGDTNLFGRAIIADGRLAGKLAAGDLMVLRFGEPDDDRSLYTYAFLASSIGLRLIRACAYGTSIPRMRPDLVQEIPVAVPDKDIISRVAALIRKVMTSRETYLHRLRAGRGVIEALPEMREAHSMCAERRARCVTWSGPLITLNAWNYASTGGGLDFLLRRWSGRLADAAGTGGLYYGPRFARVPAEPPHGIEFMSQRDAFLIRPAPRRIAHPGFEDRQLFVSPGTIMLGAQGTLGEGELFGRAMLVHGKIANAAFTQHLLRVELKPNARAIGYAFLSTALGMRLLRSTAVGTKLLSMRNDLLQRLPFPDLDNTQATRVTKHIGDALKAREAADAAETEAIRIVEEEVLPAWLT